MEKAKQAAPAAVPGFVANDGSMPAMLARYRRRRMPSGFVLYEGPSLIDGAPVVVIVTGTGARRSSNEKTGAMLQTWILRADVDPLTANRTGADRAVCGDCPLRGRPAPEKARGTAEGRGCYVQIGQAPASVWRTYRAGKYPRAIVYGGLFFAPWIASTGGRCIGYGEMVRLGSYGDPAAVPADIWARLTRHAAGWTGYSHQSATPGAAFDPDRMMASADTETDARAAWSRGWRTFRIVAAPADIVRGREVICPATPEGGSRATCASCGLCRGAVTGGRSVAVVAHGAGKGHALRVAA